MSALSMGREAVTPPNRKHTVTAFKFKGLSLTGPQNHIGCFFSNAEVQAPHLEILFQGKQGERGTVIRILKAPQVTLVFNQAENH